MAVDATCCRMVGLGVDQVSYFNTARERGLGNFKEDDIEIRGKSIKDVFQQIWLPYLEGFDRWPEYNFYTENAGSSCLGLIACTTERMKARGTYDKNAGISIVVGKKKELPKGVPKEKMILFGDCVKKYAKDGIYVHGCTVPASSLKKSKKYSWITLRSCGQSQWQKGARRNKPNSLTNIYIK